MSICWICILQIESSSRRRMNIVHPINFLGGLGWCDLQIDHDRFLAAADEHTAQRFLAAGVDLLVWHKGWHINKVARAGVGDILKVLAPPHARPPTEDAGDLTAVCTASYLFKTFAGQEQGPVPQNPRSRDRPLAQGLP
jgi:hypothetical protein